jgi:hypothetical protein
MAYTDVGSSLPADNTHVSTPGGFSASAQAGGTAPGASGVGANLQISHAILVVIGGAAAALVALGFVFRRGGGRSE